MLYKQFARPYLDYCDFIVDSSLKENVGKFDKIQKRAMRMINYGQRESMTYAEIMSLYDIESLYNRRA